MFLMVLQEQKLCLLVQGTAVMRASEEQLKSGVKNKACEVHVLKTFKFIFRLLVEF